MYLLNSKENIQKVHVLRAGVVYPHPFFIYVRSVDFQYDKAEFCDLHHATGFLLATSLKSRLSVE